MDGVTWQKYETGLEGRRADLHSRVHRGAYRAQPSRRVCIPKPGGRQRPPGVAALEDKTAQQGVARILSRVGLKGEVFSAVDGGRAGRCGGAGSLAYTGDMSDGKEEREERERRRAEEKPWEREDRVERGEPEWEPEYGE